MRRLTPAFFAAAVILVPIHAQAANKPNVNVRALLPAVKTAPQLGRKTGQSRQQFMIIRMKEVMITGVQPQSSKPNPGRMSFEHYFDK